MRKRRKPDSFLDWWWSYERRSNVSRQGHYASFMGAIGHDPAGQAVIADLDKENIDTHLVRYSLKYSTGIFSFYY